MRCTGLIAAMALMIAASASEAQTLRAAVLRVETGNALPLSRLDLPPADLGFAGARLATADNQTTGTFLKQTFETVEISAKPEEAAAALEGLIAQGVGFVVTLADATTTLALSDAAGDRALIFNALSADDALRNADCRANVIQVGPSHAMKADALAQFLMWKKWSKWFLVQGPHPADQAWADAIRRSATKFGAKIVETKTFEDTGGGRQSDTGHVQVQKQMPVLTQAGRDYDVLVAADQSDLFAAYLPYQSWDPRPVAGSAGLRPVSWSPAQEAWGATQFQRRFERQAGRAMREEDYQVWMALRMLGEAATRSKATDYATVRAWILGPDFELAAFKGQKLTIRPWDHQLRQPVVLAYDKLIVSVSPQDEYLHQVSQLDTLGTDRPETTCKFK